MSKKIPSILVNVLESVPKKLPWQRISKMPSTSIENGNSIYAVFLCTVKGIIKPAIPRIPNKLKLLLPITFPKTMASFACMFTANSGALVPKATTVRPIANSETPYFLARFEAPSTKKSAPLITRPKPRPSKRIDSKMLK